MESVGTTVFEKEKTSSIGCVTSAITSHGENLFSPLSTSAMLASNNIPLSHKRIADNYMIIKKIFGFPVVQSRISHEEILLLNRYDFLQLEYSTAAQINEEISYLKKWAFSVDEGLRVDAENILLIRAKELKFLVAGKYTSVSNEMFDGYKALEQYFEYISKYRNHG